MPTFFDHAQKYGVNTSKPFFPVNSLRLLYFLIADSFTEENPEVIEKIGSLIPKVEAVFAARGQHRSTAVSPSAQSDLEAAAGPLREVFAVIDTPPVHHIFDQLFSYVYPLQDELFLSIYQDILSEKDQNAHHLMALLKVRAMDSIIFSTLISEIVTSASTPVLHYQINLAYQINDLVDAVVFAKDDVEANSFSPFQVIRRAAPEPQAAKELIKKTLEDFVNKASVFPFPEPLQSEVVKYYQELVGVVKGNS